MTEGTRHFISHEWLPTMRTLPIDGEPWIFLRSIIKRWMTLGWKPKFHAEMHSPPVAFPWPKFLLFPNYRYTNPHSYILCVGNNARNYSNATSRFRLCDLLNWYLIMRVLPVMDVGFLMWFSYLYSFYLTASLKQPPLSPALHPISISCCCKFLFAPWRSKLIMMLQI
jgi:hypothetical protein